ncbi:MAG TPA: proline--tRNA ligase, partial [Bacteroidales bacterium]|jgi:prolyl-tRNA synthetase|nr:proline--tRNA ligase [Bacteroidales bacterium]HON96724.1 proline--tRNA ligase [Bacteroidales bacterium]HQH58895.1 proline--tRNA ligase [Bacteroidales bacterium]HQJ59043.1 proline--tRNA ligase [Bacteroidales bacterium]HQM77788.1 proline--tRNA ligase [Bacteroidales bacterium]
MKKAITPRNEDYSQWYLDIIEHANLAENSVVRGCMVIKPYGFSLWENIQSALDKMFKDTGHTNAYFPIFIPKSFFSREAEHVEGFASECAIVTHYRLKKDPNSRGLIVDEDAKLEEELVVRPTSETIIWSTYKNWIQSYRDLPLLINQWANVVRWEMRTRLFLRTTEFLWQEGHTAHATRQEAIEEAERMLNIYAKFAEDYMAIPVIKGIKTANERFAGAEETYCIEAMMQDGKALQAGTSHFLGQNFAKAFDVKFLNRNNELEYVWATSWGVSTRLIGAIIMTHSDDKGLVLPPRLAPTQVILIPIFKTEEEKSLVLEKLNNIKNQLLNNNIRVKLDDSDDNSPGWKFAEWEMRGVPLRLALGPKDLANNTIEFARRDTGEKQIFSQENIVENVKNYLENIQQNLYNKALAYRETRTYYADNWDEFVEKIENGNFVWAHWDGTTETELKIKELTKATIRLIPLDVKSENGTCILTGNPSKHRVLFARAY